MEADHIKRAQRAVNQWWDRENRFAALENHGTYPDDRMDPDILELVALVEESTGKAFDYLTGRWKKV